MLHLNRAAAGLLLLGLAGCGTMPAGDIAGQPSTEVTVTREQGARFLSVVGPHVPHDQPFLGVPNTNFFALRSLIDTRTGETTHQLYVEDSYFGAKRNWAAASANGQPLKFVPISTNEITCEQNCSYAEEFAANIPDPMLRGSPQGLSVRFTAKSGTDKVILIPGGLIQKQLAAVDQARATLPTASAAPPPPQAVPTPPR
jgi:hypothetical protein